MKSAKFKLILSGDGGDLYIGKVNRATYNFFKEQKIDIDAYARLDWDNKKVIPKNFNHFHRVVPTTVIIY